MTAHLRVTCPSCNWWVSPSRLGSYPVRFARTEFTSGGRNQGRWSWQFDVDVPERSSLLRSLRDQLQNALRDVQTELDLELQTALDALLLEPLPEFRARGLAQPAVTGYSDQQKAGYVKTIAIAR